jgi:hypothetical protein
MRVFFFVWLFFFNAGRDGWGDPIGTSNQRLGFIRLLRDFHQWVTLPNPPHTTSASAPRIKALFVGRTTTLPLSALWQWFAFTHAR